ncbi:type VII secretion integral membrane protein EccD [Actinomadura sp. LD22]|uniref:Type VII secretion integral membrane protein EccD n=1 Tax=Actinomadura physcomitrii TaxID=2650748 RepID=A0A6I4MM55_9ACTN|nr:type VII secretion integral membrane protein EccD [Actinomadura physcomitrii]MWA06713.1 type VII secretion integral membrane protein EccD [Actinomadura physcomitrii]
MNTSTGADLCRVVVVAPHRRLDLSLPGDIPLSHMLPTLLQVAGHNLADAGLAHSGWVLQRLDEAPLDESRSLSALGVRDGEILYFRPELSQFPEVAFDDVADVVATGVNEYADRWRPETTRRFGLLAGAAALGLGAVGVALAGPPWGLLAAASAGIAAVLLLAGIVLSRALGDSGAGAVLGYSALPYAFLAGLLAPARPVPLLHLGTPHLAAAFAAVTLAAVVSAFAIHDGLPTFLGIAFVALLGLVSAALVQGLGLSPSGMAALDASLCLAVTALIPSLAFRLARLPLPPVPENAEELRSAQTFDGPTLLRRTREADRFATGLVSAVGLAGLGAQLLLLTTHGWLPVTMSLCLSAVLFLRARVFHGRSQRLWMLLSGLAGLAVLALHRAVTAAPAVALATVVLPAALAVIVMTAMALTLPARKPSPFWGRAGDIVDILLIISLLPLALGLLDLYSWLRGLAG